MPEPTTSTYTILHSTTGKEQTIRATRVEHDTKTGRTSFYDGDELVAQYVNISFSKEA